MPTLIFLRSDGYKYWHDTSVDASTYSERWRPPYQHAPTNDIEMTSYALLTYARKGDVGSAIPVIRWLTSKQNELGGYSSTQVCCHCDVIQTQILEWRLVAGHGDSGPGDGANRELVQRRDREADD